MKGNNQYTHPWTEKEASLLVNNYKGKLNQELLDKFPKRTKQAVQIKASNLGLTTNDNLWTEEERNILVTNYQTTNINDLLKLLPRKSKGSIYTHAYQYNLSLPQGEKYRFEVNDSFFENPNIYNSYWAGFIAADGCIVNNNRGITISLKSDDRQHLEKFRKAIDSQVSVKNYVSKPNNYSTISITSKRMVEDLNRIFSITPRKSLTLKPPNLVNPNHIDSFIVGLIDGDGTICRTSDNRNIRISLLGTKFLLDWVKTHIDTYYPTHNLYQVNLRKTPSKAYRLDYSGIRAQRIFECLSAIGLPYLERKWNMKTSL